MSGLDNYIEGLVAGDAEMVVAAPAPEIRLHVAVHDAAIEGRDAARTVFTYLFDGLFSNLRVRDRIGTGDVSAFLFDVDVAGVPVPAEGANVVRLDDQGRPREITVFLRPLRCLNVLARQMGKRFGQPPAE